MAHSTSDYLFCQVFGDKTPIDEITDVDIVSAVSFDETGNFLAAGDKGGRLVLFEADPDDEHKYKFYTEFQSHEPEFDYLKSLEIEEKINQIRWCKRQNDSHLLLTTNDKTVKLWKVHDKKIKKVTTMGDGGASSEFQFPSVSVSDEIVSANPRRVFSNAHAYHINTISLNSDGETFISADDLRINLWNLDISDHSYNVVDIKPENMEELTEVITSATCHPQHCHLFMYSSSKGTITLADMRESALCDDHGKVYAEEEDPSSNSFFSEIIASISDAKFTRCGKYIISRDYLTLKVWDVAQDARPVATINIHDYLRSKLCDLYENDWIFDKFECNISGDGTHIVTGSYNTYFFIYDWRRHMETVASGREVDDEILKDALIETDDPKSTMLSLKSRKAKAPGKSVNPDNLDYNSKALHIATHPEDPVIALACNNNLFLFDIPSNANGSLDSSL
eukprot:TRINITY_DN317_c1_g1_i1.p1 TRINITY_DN317_c1_g1~~TRINITY_DN317_c1_g1_i1.p1  ORF type:complete len:451 (+),score=127.85 TRINITY_DN317_c1_g1_i1:51-1403(+)